LILLIAEWQGASSLVFTGRGEGGYVNGSIPVKLFKLNLVNNELPHCCIAASEFSSCESCIVYNQMQYIQVPLVAFSQNKRTFPSLAATL